jgi:hypothetical protein
MKNLDKKIKIKNKTDKQYVYEVESLPINIVLLPKSKNIDYNNNGTVVNALETYQTIVNWI